VAAARRRCSLGSRGGSCVSVLSLYPGYRITKGSEAPGAPSRSRLKPSSKSAEDHHKRSSRYTYPTAHFVTRQNTHTFHQCRGIYQQYALRQALGREHRWVLRRLPHRIIHDVLG
jgi:hypothetical protein